MKKTLIRLTESDLHKIIKESVTRAINEMDEMNDPSYEGQPGFLNAMKDSYNSDPYDDSLQDGMDDSIDSWDNSTGLDRLGHKASYLATRAGRHVGRLGRWIHSK